jgi:hypothetical protein
VCDLGHFFHKIAFFVVTEAGFEVALNERHIESPLLKPGLNALLFRSFSKA